MKHKNHENNIWLLLDDRPGNYSQVLGVAKALGMEYTSKKFNYNKLSKLPNLLLRKTIKHINNNDRKQFKPPWPKLIIGCGRKSAPIGRWIKKESHNYSKYIQIMWPAYPYKDLDLIFTPSHDNINNKKNVINIQTSPNIIDKKLLSESKVKWKTEFNQLNQPRITLVIGGDTKLHKFNANHIKQLFIEIKEVMNDKGSLLITTSRRTSKEAYEAIKNEIRKLKIQSVFWDPKYKNPNPYYGYLSYADIVIVTGDSVSISSEVCATGKPLLIYAPNDITIKKHKLFHTSLIKKGIAQYLNKSNLKNIKQLKYKAINESENIAKIIKQTYLKN
jgi:mitochondrial fission protein ELM1